MITMMAVVRAASPGSMVAGKYQVERVLAHGGMSVVVAARHAALDKAVAIKFLVLPPDFDRDEAVTRFLREARTAAKIESDHVCRVFDVGIEDDTPFMVMEHLEGLDLEVELEARGRLPVDEAVDIAMQALEGVGAAHALGVVHRDLKPGNLFLAARADGVRRVKIVDFGISKVEGREAKLTDTQGSFGTPSYMSPEQIKNTKKTDLRTDIWAVGAILYEMVTGRPPFEGETSGEILAAVLEGTPPPVRSLAPHVPEALEAAIHRCLRRDRDQRFASAAALAEALAPFAPAPGPGSERLLLAGAAPRAPSSAAIRVREPEVTRMASEPDVRTSVTAWTASPPRTSRLAVRAIVGTALVAVLLVGALSWRAWTARGGTVTGVSAASIPPPAAPSAAIAEPPDEPSPPSSASAVAVTPAASSAEPAPPSTAKHNSSKAAVVAKPTSAPAPRPAARKAKDLLRDSY